MGPSLAQECTVKIDSDVLGLGVRLGIYLQLASTLCLYAIRRSEAIGSIALSNMLFTGFYVSIIKSLKEDNFPPNAMSSVAWLLTMDFLVLILLIFSGLMIQHLYRYGPTVYP